MADRLITHSRPSLGPREEAAVAAAVRSGFVGGNGAITRRFAGAIAGRAERGAGLGLANGTVALELALRVIGAEGGRVAVPAFACLSVERAVRRAGGVPVLVDIDPDHLSFPYGALDELSSSCAAAICVHQFGLPSPTIADGVRTGLPIVEDYTTAIGGSVNGRPVGAEGRIGVVSFSATKMICAAAGAVLIGDAADVSEAARWMHPESSVDRHFPVPNALLTDLAAALGEVQLEQLDGFVERRTAIAREYQSVVAELGLEAKRPGAGADATWWRFLVALPSGHDVDAVVAAARAQDVVFARPVTHPPSDQRGEFPVAERMRETLVSMPIYPSLSDADVERVSGVLRTSVAQSLAAHR